jgi:hypothetical protein
MAHPNGRKCKNKWGVLSGKGRGPLFGSDALCLLTLPLSLRNSRHPSRMRLAIWIVGLTALATSLDSAYGGFYGRAIARMLTDMAHGFGLG